MRKFIPSNLKVRYDPCDIAPHDRKDVLLVEFTLCDERTDGHSYDSFFLDHLATACIGEYFYTANGFTGEFIEARPVRCSELGEDDSWWQLRVKGMIPISIDAYCYDEYLTNMIRGTMKELHGSTTPHLKGLIKVPFLKEVPGYYEK